MNSSRAGHVSLALTLVIVLAAMPAVSGCKGASAKEILEKSSTSMENISSAKMHTLLTMQTGGRSSASAFEIEEVTKGPEGTKIKMVGEVGGQKEEIYVVGGTMYTHTLGKWYKQTYQAAGLLSLEDVRASMAGAENAKIVDEDTDYTISYNPGRDFEGKQLQRLKDRGIDLGLQPNIRVDVAVKINKKSSYVTEEVSKMVFSGGRYGDTTINSTITLAEFNTKITIEVPKEALSATTLLVPVTP